MKYMQTDKRWGSLGYPKAPYTIRTCGCGEVSICNCIIEMEQYKKYTPKTIQPYCKQYADPHGNGTYWSGIIPMMKHYGMTEVQEHATVKPLWKELAKGNRVAVFLMGSRKGGSKGVHWTSSGHFVCATKYKHENGLHKLYVKDSYSNSKLRNGWITYEGNMKGDVIKVWSGKLNSKKPKAYEPTTPYTHGLPNTTVKKGSKGVDVKHLQNFLNWAMDADLTVDGVAGSATVSAIKDFEKANGLTVDGIFGAENRKKAQSIIKAHAPSPAPAPVKKEKTWADKAISWAKKIAKDDSWHYVFYNSGKKAHECPICKKHPKGKYHGFNCIGFAYSALAHGAGIKIKHTPGVIDNAKAERILKAGSDAKATKIVTDALGNKHFKVIRDRNGIPQSKMKPGDIGLYYKGSTYQHTFLYIGDGKMIDCISSGDNIKVRHALTPKVVIRYTGK